uniref:Uncharacterized protein n=1 Tax=Anguilla anguilla TaxID=7936 RepID=A0A0E9RPZ8_ANGAN
MAGRCSRWINTTVNTQDTWWKWPFMSDHSLLFPLPIYVQICFTYINIIINILICR